MTVNRAKQNTQQVRVIPDLQSPMFRTNHKILPTEFSCRAAYNEIPPEILNLKVRTKAKIPFVSIGISSLTGTILSSILNSDNINTGTAVTILAFLGAAIQAVTGTRINSMQKLAVKDYIRSLKSFLTNCDTHISAEEREKIETQIDLLRKVTNASYAAYLKDHEAKGSSLARSIKPVALKQKAQRSKPVMVSKKVQLPPPSVNAPDNNFRPPTLSEIGDGIGNFAKGVAAVGTGLAIGIGVVGKALAGF